MPRCSRLIQLDLWHRQCDRSSGEHRRLNTWKLCHCASAKTRSLRLRERSAHQRTRNFARALIDIADGVVFDNVLIDRNAQRSRRRLKPAAIDAALFTQLTLDPKNSHAAK